VLHFFPGQNFLWRISFHTCQLESTNTWKPEEFSRKDTIPLLQPGLESSVLRTIHTVYTRQGFCRTKRKMLTTASCAFTISEWNCLEFPRPSCHKF